VDVPHIAGNYLTGARHFYDFLSGDHDRLTVKSRCATCRKPPPTPTRAPRCATTARGPAWTYIVATYVAANPDRASDVRWRNHRT
jgi:hypothetical protein